MRGTDNLYLKPVGGLCNRMRAIDSAVTLADQLGKRLVVFWGRDVYLNCRYSDLFKPSESFDLVEERQWLGKKVLFPYLPGSKPSNPVKKGLYTLTKIGLNINSEIWFEDIEQAVSPLDADIQPEKVRSMKEYETRSFPHISPLLNLLHVPGSSFVCSAWKLKPSKSYDLHFKPIEVLDKQILMVTKGFNRTVGVHIRRGDHTSAIMHSTVNKFIRVMDQEVENNEATFFLATDCRTTEAEFVKRYPDRIYSFPKSSYSRNTTQGIQEALVDLYCLSRTEKILGSYYSSFSQVAAEISGLQETTIY